MEFPRHFLKNEKTWWSFQYLFKKSSYILPSIFWISNGISEALFFTKNSVIHRGYTDNFWNGRPANSLRHWAWDTHISTLSHTIFEKLDFSRNLMHFRFLKKPPPISKILAKKFPAIFWFTEKTFPNFSISRKMIPWFPSFWKKISLISNFGKTVKPG